MFEDANEIPSSTGNENLDMVVGGIKKALPFFEKASNLLAEKIEDGIDNLMDIFF